MEANVISYVEMCRREGVSLQQGMNFGLGGKHSVILMSIRPNAPYRDRVEDSGTTVVYEGHDQPKGLRCPNPKVVDQLERLPSGGLTQNGKFHQAAQAFVRKETSPAQVRVYEKIRTGIWVYNGPFHLVDSWTERDEWRTVFKFRLVAVEEEQATDHAPRVGLRRRVIPTSVKLEVWARDRGRCAICDAADELHFDHIVPFAKGGSSITAQNVQLLCARHNLEKRDRIE